MSLFPLKFKLGFPWTHWRVWSLRTARKESKSLEKCYTSKDRRRFIYSTILISVIFPCLNRAPLDQPDPREDKERREPRL